MKKQIDRTGSKPEIHTFTDYDVSRILAWSATWQAPPYRGLAWAQQQAEDALRPARQAMAQQQETQDDGE